MPVWGDDPAVLRCDHRPDPEERSVEPDVPRAGRARPAAEILGWSRRLLDPALRDAVARMPDAVREIAAFHFGWSDERGRPAPAGGGGGKAIRPALALLAAEAVGGDASAALPAAVAVELAHN